MPPAGSASKTRNEKTRKLADTEKKNHRY